MKTHLEKIGGFGGIIAAAACPVCFPKLALLGAIFGLGALGAYESELVIAAQVLVAVAVLGHIFAYRRHRQRWLLGLGVLSGAAVFAGLYRLGSEAVVYAGFAGLVVTSATDYWARFRKTPGSSQRNFPATAELDKGASGPAMESVLSCPNCGHSKRERMPTDSCQFFYECAGCGALLRPKAGDCCVFCSYGSAKCPPMQTAGIR